MTIDKNYYDLSRKLLDELDRGMEEGPELSGAEMLRRRRRLSRHSWKRQMTSHPLLA